MELDRVERLCANTLARRGAQRDEVTVARVTMYRERAVDLIDDPVMRDARLMIATELRHRVRRSVRVADDLADPIGRTASGRSFNGTEARSRRQPATSGR